MKFKSYTEIENVYRSDIIQMIRDLGYDKPSFEWVAEVKWDGSNLQCCIDVDDNLVVGKRSSYIGNDMNFQGFPNALEHQSLDRKLRQMKTYIRDAYRVSVPFLDDHRFGMRVYGELAGGCYRHPDVEKVKNAKIIQGRVQYHPDDVFLPFDIELVNETDDIIYTFSQHDVCDICQHIGLPYPLIRGCGTFDEMLNLPCEFNDETGHILFGLPILENNTAEGLVIKPNLPLCDRFGHRIMLKNKNGKFSEKSRKSPKEKKELRDFNELEIKYMEILREYITESRFMSVLSKVGEVNEKMFGMFLGMFLKDMNTDFNKEHGAEIEDIENQHDKEEFDFSRVRKDVSIEVRNFILPLFMNQIKH